MKENFLTCNAISSTQIFNSLLILFIDISEILGNGKVWTLTLTCVSFNTAQHSKVTQNMHNMTSVLLHCIYSFIFVHCATNES